MQLGGSDVAAVPTSSAPGVLGGAGFQGAEHQSQGDDLCAAVAAGRELAHQLVNGLQVCDAEHFGGDLAAAVFLDQPHIAGQAVCDEDGRTLGRCLGRQEFLGDELPTHLLGGIAQLVERDDLAALPAFGFGLGCGPCLSVLVVVACAAAVFVGDGLSALGQDVASSRPAAA